MDLSEQQTESNLPLNRLVSHALGELEKHHYSRRSLRRYRTVWEHLLRFCREMNLGEEYSEHLAARFEDAYRLQNGEHAKAKEEWRRHIPFLIKVLGDIARDGRLEHTRIDTSRLQVPAAMKKSLTEYEQYARDRRHPYPQLSGVLLYSLQSRAASGRGATASGGGYRCRTWACAYSRRQRQQGPPCPLARSDIESAA